MCAASETPRITVYVGLGTNVGDRVGFLRDAIRRLRETDGFSFGRLSTIYETEPVGPAAQGPFLNGVVEGETTLPPRVLLKALKDIESATGRTAREKWGPREIDLDLLLYGEWAVEGEDFTVPHPRLHERDFVLLPLSELCPDREHPVLKKSIQTLLTESGAFHASHPKPYSATEAGETV